MEGAKVIDIRQGLKKQDMSSFPCERIQVSEENSLLYDVFSPDNEDDWSLYFSIKERGIIEPLHISADMVLLSGHRRLSAARVLKLKDVPCIVENIMFKSLSQADRLKTLADYNKQRDKSFDERLREAITGINPEDTYQKVLQDRLERSRIKIENNVELGSVKKRSRITTMMFLHAVKRVLEDEKEFWPLTVRRVHYLLLNDPPLRHDKKPDSTYTNDQKSYKALSNLLTRARFAGEIPHEAIEDLTRPIHVVQTYQSPTEYIKGELKNLFGYYWRDLQRGQKKHIEILLEKEGIFRHVKKVADEYTIPCTMGRGFASPTPRLKMVNRFIRSCKDDLIILILSDFDPDGEQIAASFSRSLRDDFGISGDRITAHKVMISGGDVEKYNLPSDLEAKSKSPNYKKFVAKHGTHVAELDAAPVSLIQEKLRTAIESCLDMDTFQAEREQEMLDYVEIEATKKMVMDALKR